MLFSLLPPNVQPVSVVKSLLAAPSSDPSVFHGVKSSRADGLDLTSVLGESPSALMPDDFRPRYDEGMKAYFVPGMPRQVDENEAELVFGARGPFPISKVRNTGGAARGCGYGGLLFDCCVRRGVDGGPCVYTWMI